MSLHVLTDLRRDLNRFQAQVRLGELTPQQANAWFERLNDRLDDVDAYLTAARISEQLETVELTDLGGVQPGRRTRTSARLSIVDGGRA